ncbi:MAG TPA: chemotaxis protein CheW [Urbifossiella sp.]
MANLEPYVLFELAGTSYAIASSVVQRMEMVEAVTPVPNAAEFVEGVVFSRGKVVPAVNLRRRFGFVRAERDLKTRLIVVDHNGGAVGLIVDSAREFVAIPSEAIQPPPAALAGMSGGYLTGIASIDGKVILILDVAEVLNYSASLISAPGESGP